MTGNNTTLTPKSVTPEKRTQLWFNDKSMDSRCSWVCGAGTRSSFRFL